VAMGGKGVDGTSRTSDGRGIDHFVDAFLPQLLTAYCDNASGDPTGTLCEQLT